MKHFSLGFEMSEPLLFHIQEKHFKLFTVRRTTVGIWKLWKCCFLLRAACDSHGQPKNIFTFHSCMHCMKSHWFTNFPWVEHFHGDTGEPNLSTSFLALWQTQWCHHCLALVQGAHSGNKTQVQCIPQVIHFLQAAGCYDLCGQMQKPTNETRGCIWTINIIHTYPLKNIAEPCYEQYSFHLNMVLNLKGKLFFRTLGLAIHSDCTRSEGEYTANAK